MAGHEMTLPGRRGAGGLPAAGGFTLVEILVVLAILATLISLVAAIVPSAMRAKAVSRTQGTMNQVGIALEALQIDKDFGRYPYTRLKDLKVGKKDLGKQLGSANDINCGIETLWFLLNNPDVRLDRDLSIPADMIANTDGDRYRSPLSNAQDLDAREYLDAWGNPLVYFHSNDYKDPKGVDRIQLGSGEVVEVRPKKVPSAAGGGFLRPTSFQLFSLGPDGVQDADDLPEDEEGDDIVFMVD